MGRIGTANRETGEVNIAIELRLDEENLEQKICLTTMKEEPDVSVEIFQHLIAQILRFAKIWGHITGKGDLPHHLIEDVAICLGQALRNALGKREGIARTASHIMPMEGSLITVSVDMGGRGYATIDVRDMDNKSLAGMFQHFLTAVATHGGFDLYAKVETVGDLSIRSDHHKIETLGKALGKILREAMAIEGTYILSTKDTLT